MILLAGKEPMRNRLVIERFEGGSLMYLNTILWVGGGWGVKLGELCIQWGPALV